MVDEHTQKIPDIFTGGGTQTGDQNYSKMRTMRELRTTELGQANLIGFELN